MNALSKAGLSIALATAAALAALSGGAARAAACAPLHYEDADYTICTFDARRDDVRTFWKGGDGRPFGGFAALAADLNAHGRALLFAMNAGMYETDLSPVGLYVEDGKVLRKLNLRDGGSNFYLKPNGVFFVGDHRLAIMEAQRYSTAPPQPRYATQSGPMLVIDGQIHPKILPTGASAKIRNGVGVRDATTAVFAISDAPVTFSAFARLFRDALKCPNALYLDGSISSLFAPDLKRDDSLWPVGPIVAVTAPSPAH